MIFGSVCSGIEAASVAWLPLGWQCAFVAEIEPFPCAVLAHHYPDVPNLGDITKFKAWPDAAIDVLVGGTPCQAFSIAGLRKGLADPRGNLTLVYLGILDRFRPEWMVWENVPGVLSNDEGRAFGTFLGGLAKLGYGFAYRVLDAQYFHLPQRRERVFVVGHSRDWRRAAAVLFEPESLSGNPPPRRNPQENAAAAIGSSAQGDRQPFAYGGANGSGPIDVATAVRAHGGSGHIDFESETFIAFHPSQDPDVSGPIAHALGSKHAGDSNAVLFPDCSVRRLTPLEWERLQGFPDGYTAITYRKRLAKDGPRYKAIGNSMATRCMTWIGERIAAVSAMRTAA